ncbi:MAG: ATP-binding protein [Candidatus Parabeggiatoa sp. nov. 3]|nr:MAG: ATP-binding protein [Gammaproteobacteria bacterium]RKZ62855.1 MAG: ATP-binding protein [Gammaproteobacteria bacterium]RKZ88562.1 MAG: ATP-binding protein [Gammaproteobacteria bacterium]HEW98612.1 ATP-binding protein [Beggiatoa sp.]
MQLIIQNFGPIKKGQIDLSKKVYVFVGYNNSGKTYLSQLLWSLFHNKTIERFANEMTLKELNLEDKDSLELTSELLDIILEKFSDFLTRHIIPKTLNIDSHHFTLEQLSLDFQYNLNDIKNAHREGVATLQLNEKKGQFLIISKVQGTLKVTFEEKHLPIELMNTLQKPFLSLNENVVEQSTSSIRKVTLIKFILSVLMDNVHQPFFLPSSRLFYPIFYQYIYRLEKEKREALSKERDALSQMLFELLKNKEKGEELALESLPVHAFESHYQSPYTEPMNWLFDKIYRLNEETKVTGYYEQLVYELSQIMGGDIITKQVQGLAPIDFYLKMNEQGNDLPMYLSSSSVNQLSTLYLYFKYWAEKHNNFLMIDEPEENLHPKNQIALLNVLLEFANDNNNKVLITTHSPLLADAVNNYIYLGWLKSQQIPIDKAINSYPEINPNLNLTEIGIYFFEGTRIIPYEQKDYGVHFKDFSYEIRKIKNISEILTDQIYQVINKED